MKIFDREGKINFVDENNVFLGYDMGQCCCERADWYISDIETYGVRDRDPKESEGLGGWIFDTKYFKKVDCNDLDEGESKVAKTIAKGQKAKKSTFSQSLKHQKPKKTSSGVHKRKPREMRKKTDAIIHKV